MLSYYGANEGIISIQPNQKKLKLHPPFFFFSHHRRRSDIYFERYIYYPQHISRETEVSIRAWDWSLAFSVQTGNLSQAKIRPEREKENVLQ